MKGQNMSDFTLENKLIGRAQPTYFIADIAANHDGDIERAKELIYLCAEAGADAAKFQHFQAKTIVSDRGFKTLGSQQSHQSNWSKSVFEVYEDASVDQNWTPILKETCEKAGVTFMTTPYSLELVDAVDKYVNAFKIGSGDITWLEIIDYIAQKNKPIFLASGAASMDEVELAMSTALLKNKNVVLMQCNTNYTASLENFKYINLNVLKKFHRKYPDITLGLSDHTPGHATVLGAVALGAKVIEKHFTDDTNRVGPDHKFAMDPVTWRDMVDRTRELELAMGSPEKKVEDNEVDTVVIQRRALRASRDMKKGEIITADCVEALRPCPLDALPPYQKDQLINRSLQHDIAAGDYFTWNSIS